MKQDANNNTKKTIYALFLLSFCILMIYTVFYKAPKVFEETVEKVERKVIVTDVGIADAVEKVYDSYVSISIIKDDNIVNILSGFIYNINDDDMYIISSYFNYENEVIKIKFSDGDVTDGSIVGTNELYNISVIKCSKKDKVTKVAIGNSFDVKPGDNIFILKPSFGNDILYNISRGIISSHNKIIKYNEHNILTIQTDILSNDNSDKPLFNSNGEIIGIINSSLTSNNNYYATVIDDIVEQAEYIINKDNNKYPSLNVSMINVEDSKYYNDFNNISNLDKGILIIDTLNSNDLNINDIIIAINGLKVDNINELRKELYKSYKKEDVKLKVIRNNEEIEININIR